MNPQISVVIPCYNQAHLLGEALDSIRRQDMNDWEVVVVDDCSTKGDVGAVIRACADPRVRGHRHAVNRGLSAARNTGMADARADLLMPLDSDDCLAPSYLRQAVACFANPDVDYVYSDYQLFGGTSNGVWRYGYFEPAEIGRRQVLPACGALRRRTWEAVGGYCEALELRVGNEDWDFWIGVVSHGFRGVHLPEPLYQYRQLDGSMTCSLKPTMYQTHEFIAARHRAFLERHGVLEAFLRFGYESSAFAEANRSGYAQAVRLACQALKLGSTNPAIKQLAAWGRLPDYVVGPCLRFRSLCAAARNYLRNGLRNLSGPVRPAQAQKTTLEPGPKSLSQN